MDRQRIKFPYGRCEIEIEISSENFMGVLKSIDPPGVNDQRAEIDRSLKEPIGTETMKSTLALEKACHDYKEYR